LAPPGMAVAAPVGCVVGNPEVKSRVASLNFSTDGLPVTRPESATSVNQAGNVPEADIWISL